MYSQRCVGDLPVRDDMDLSEMHKGNHRYVSEVVCNILTVKHASGGSAADCGMEVESSSSLSERPYRPVWCSCCCSCCVDEWLAAAPAGLEFLLESHCGAHAYTLTIAQPWNKLQKSASRLCLSCCCSANLASSHIPDFCPRSCCLTRLVHMV